MLDLADYLLSSECGAAEANVMLNLAQLSALLLILRALSKMWTRGSND